MHPFADLFYPTEDFNPTACNKDTNYNSVFAYWYHKYLYSDGPNRKTGSSLPYPHNLQQRSRVNIAPPIGLLILSEAKQ